MKLSGKIEVFMNKRGYVTGVFKDWDEENKSVLGKAYVDVLLPEEIAIKEGESLTLDVEEAYLNARYVKSNGKDFTKLQINVVKALVSRRFPEEAKKTTKKGGKR